MSDIDDGIWMSRKDHEAEVERLTRWKREAIEVLAAWDKVHDALGKPGRLGESKAAASKAEASALRTQLDEAVRLLRQYWLHCWIDDDNEATVGAFLATIDKEASDE